jgi:xanthine/uracil permease
MQLRVRTLMIVVAAVAVVLGLVGHVHGLVRDEDDFAAGILMLEGIAVSVLFALVLAVVFVVRFVRKDDAYATDLRRNDFPARCPLTLVEPNSPDQE